MDTIEIFCSSNQDKVILTQVEGLPTYRGVLPRGRCPGCTAESIPAGHPALRFVTHQNGRMVGCFPLEISGTPEERIIALRHIGQEDQATALEEQLQKNQEWLKATGFLEE